MALLAYGTATSLGFGVGCDAMVSARTGGARRGAVGEGTDVALLAMALPPTSSVNNKFRFWCRV